MSQQQDEAHFYTELLKALKSCREHDVPENHIRDLAIGCRIDRRDVEVVIGMKQAA